MNSLLKISITEYSKTNSIALIDFLKPINDIEKFYKIIEELHSLLKDRENQKIHYLYNISNLKIKGTVVATILRDIKNEFFTINKTLSHPNTGIIIIINNKQKRVPPIMTAFTEAISRPLSKHVKLFTLYRRQVRMENYYNRQINNYIACKTPIICYYSRSMESNAVEEAKEVAKAIIFRKELKI